MPSTGGITSPNKVTIIKNNEDDSSVYYNVLGDINSTDIPLKYSSLFGDIKTLSTDGSEYIVLNINMNYLDEVGLSKVPSTHSLSTDYITGTALKLYKDKEEYHMSEDGIIWDLNTSIIYDNNTGILTVPMSCVNKQHQTGINDIITLTIVYSNQGTDYKEIKFYIQKV